MPAPLTLCIDTSDGASVALLDGTDTVATARSDDARRHTETLTPMIAELLAGAGAGPRDLTAIAVGTGPAPFTGLRVGLVTARTMGLALGVDVLGVCALDALAAAHARKGELLVVTDARRREVYWGRYRAGDGDVVTLDGPAVDPPATVAARHADLLAGGHVVGRGVALYAETFPGVPEAAGRAVVDPAVLGRLAVLRRDRGEDVGTAPRYLRRPDIHTSPGRKRAS